MGQTGQTGQPAQGGRAEVRELQTALHTASDIAFGLDDAPPADQVAGLVDALRRALEAARALEGSQGGTGCREHPRGAIDPLYGDKEDPLPPGWGRCLLCNDRRRRAGTQRYAAGR
ncbi:hypothetical protein CUT44_19540 [Streptomyces carminius]|uniref:Uncharacterized protein n=1 Tax=Streptomyces carminius TaxID=2665496 RepID=A0A2M8LVR5_9ACTN|nr:hypothetical protein [Streptomyces carminius]PJE95999.1 hypothetical protein CUT44_19540 [Streptomyces carminius]